MMTDAEVMAWAVTALTIGGNIGWWMGSQKQIRTCRRIAQSADLDRVYREDMRADANQPDASGKLITLAEYQQR